MKVLMDTIRDHNFWQISGDPTIGCRWDADRLDLPRVGVEPEVDYMSTEAARMILLSA